MTDNRKLIQAQFSVEEKRVVQKASDLIGLPTSTFLRSASLKEARELIIKLNNEEVVPSTKIKQLSPQIYDKR